MVADLKEKQINYELLANDISDWLKEYCKESGLNGYVAGVSGGVDSALISTLCAKTGLSCRFYSIPINSHYENNKNAFRQLEWLKKNFPNVEIEITDLSSVYDVFVEKTTFHNRLSELAKANTKCRLRHVFLYSQANTYNLLVCLSGNKIEDLGIGFATKGGDLNCGDISPIADLTKTQVWELAKYLGIPNEIIVAKPTDGLWDDPNHDDFSQIKATYPELEQIMEYIENGEKDQLSQRQQEVYEIYNHFNSKNKHKMLPIPIFKVDKDKYK